MGEGDRRVIGAETERTVTSGQRKGKHIWRVEDPRSGR